MKLIRILLPLSVVTIGFFLTTSPATATIEFAKKEKTSCRSCHVNAKVTKESHELNKTGTCYKDSKDLAKCKS